MRSKFLKKLLAVAVAGIMFFGSTVCAMAERFRVDSIDGEPFLNFEAVLKDNQYWTKNAPEEVPKLNLYQMNIEDKIEFTNVKSFYAYYVDELESYPALGNDDLTVTERKEFITGTGDWKLIGDMLTGYLKFKKAGLYLVSFDGRRCWFEIVKEPDSNTAKTSDSHAANINNSAENMMANPMKSIVLVNGKAVAFDAYNIGGNNYFKLRDVANAINGSEKQFEVTWDGSKNAINLISNNAYTAVGGEMTKGDGIF